MGVIFKKIWKKLKKLEVFNYSIWDRVLYNVTEILIASGRNVDEISGNCGKLFNKFCKNF